MIACQLCKKVPRAVFFLAPRRSEKFNFSTALLRIISFPLSKLCVVLDVLCLQDHWVEEHCGWRRRQDEQVRHLAEDHRVHQVPTGALETLMIEFTNPLRAGLLLIVIHGKESSLPRYFNATLRKKRSKKVSLETFHRSAAKTIKQFSIVRLIPWQSMWKEIIGGRILKRHDLPFHIYSSRTHLAMIIMIDEFGCIVPVITNKWWWLR